MYWADSPSLQSANTVDIRQRNLVGVLEVYDAGVLFRNPQPFLAAKPFIRYTRAHEHL